MLVSGMSHLVAYSQGQLSFVIPILSLITGRIRKIRHFQLPGFMSNALVLLPPPTNGVNNDWLPIEAEAHYSWRTQE